ncbi:MAG TPA: hypothetical protein VMT18_06355 [Planctomycetota bacterium]|nr:hypothetical protein [Planctomycetota bacterium]
MRTLVAKELRGVLPAHALLAVLVAAGWWLGVTPEAAVVPHASEQGERHLTLALGYLLAGLVLGFAQFGLERWNGTEAYLLHRATGAGGAFAAKLAASVASLALLIVAPPLTYALSHVVAGTWIVDAPLRPLVHAMVASSTALGGFAVGVFTSQLRGDWGRRVLLAVLGAGTAVFIAKVAASPIEGLGQASAARFVLTQATLAAGVLAAAFGMFRAGDDAGRPWPTRTAAAFAAVALALFTLPYVVLPSTVARGLRNAAIGAGPHVVQDPAGELYLAEPRGGREWSIRDAQGKPVPESLARTYDGYGRKDAPFHSLYRPRSTPLSWLGPQHDALEPFPARAFVFERPARRVLTPAGDAWYDVAGGRIGAVVRDDMRNGRWVELEAPARMGVSYPEGRPFGERYAPLLADAAAGRLWSLEADPGREPQLVERHLPEGERVLGVVRVQSKARLKAGLFEPIGTSTGLAIVGESGPYLWDGERLGPPEEIDPQWLSSTGALESDPDVVALHLSPVDIDGLGYTLEVRDAQSGELRITADYRVRGASALLMHAATLVSAPAAALISWTRPATEPRKADASRADPLADPLLVGRAHGGLLLAVLLLGTLLALSTWRHLGRNGTPPLARALWTAGALTLGLSAWGVARVLTPSRSTAAQSPSREPAVRERLEIVTA